MSGFERGTDRSLPINRESLEDLVRPQLEAQSHIECPYCTQPACQLEDRDITEILDGLFRNKIREFCCPCCEQSGKTIFPRAECILPGFFHKCGSQDAKQRFSVRFTLTEDDSVAIQSSFEPVSGSPVPFQHDTSPPPLETSHEGDCGQALTIFTLPNGFTLVQRKRTESIDAGRSSNETDAVRCGATHEHALEVPIHLLVPAPYRERFQCFLPVGSVSTAQLPPDVEFPQELRFTVTHCGESRVYDVGLKKKETAAIAAAIEPAQPDPSPPHAEELIGESPPPEEEETTAAPAISSPPPEPEPEPKAAPPPVLPPEEPPPRRRRLRASHAAVAALIGGAIGAAVFHATRRPSGGQRPAITQPAIPPPPSPKGVPEAVRPSPPPAPAPTPIAASPRTSPPPPPPEPTSPSAASVPASAPTKEVKPPVQRKRRRPTQPVRIPPSVTPPPSPSQAVRGGRERIYCSLDKGGQPTCTGGKPTLIGTPEYVGGIVRAHIQVACDDDGKICRDTILKAPPGVLIEVE